MSMILYGLIMCTFSLYFKGFDLLPNWLGALCIFYGVGVIAGYSPFFRKARPFALALAVLSFPIWLPFVKLHGVLSLLVSLLLGLLMLWVLFLLTRGIRDMEILFEKDFKHKALQTSFAALAILQVAHYFITPLFAPFGFLPVIAAILFIIFWARSSHYASTVL